MTTQIAILGLSALLASAGAFAHGNEDHASKPRKFDAATVEDTAFGREGDPAKVVRTIQVDMADTMRAFRMASRFISGRP